MLSMYRSICRLISIGRTEGLKEKADLFYTVGKLTEEEYNDIVSRLDAAAGSEEENA